MKYIFFITPTLMTICLACGSKNNNDSTNKAGYLDSTANIMTNQTKKVDSSEIMKAQAPYNFMDKVPGTYVRVSEADDEFIPKKVTIKLSGKRLIVGNEKYSYDVVYDKKDTILRFSSASEETGDFLGGGNIIINGDKVLYKMFFGSAAEEEYIFSKK